MGENGNYRVIDFSRIEVPFYLAAGSERIVAATVGGMSLLLLPQQASGRFSGRVVRIVEDD
jgi:hypothetical protein